MRDRSGIVGAAHGGVKAAFVVLLLAGCFWRSYGAQAATHADVLVGIARKGADLVGSGRLTAESMPELTYPLERASAFAATAARRSGAERPPSLAALETLIARYREFVDALDRARRELEPRAARTALEGPLADVEAAAAAVHAALRAEGR